MNEIRHEAGNFGQPWVIYWVQNRKYTYRASFSSKLKAEQWLGRYGHTAPRTATVEPDAPVTAS